MESKFDVGVLISDYLDEKLPPLETDKIAYKESTPSGQRIKATSPPGILIEQSLEPLCDLAYGAVEAVKEKDSEFHILRIPSTPTEHQTTETDVVIAAMTYVVIPTMEILRRLFPNQFKENSEWTQVKEEGNTKSPGSSKNNNKRLDEDSFHFNLYFSKKGISRIDSSGTMVTKRHADGTLKQDEVIAIVEFKRRGQVLHQDFDAAILKSDTTEKARRAALKEAITEPEETLLTRNGLMYTKQVSGYALSMGCPYIALFNWENLLLFNFDNMNKTRTQIGRTAGVAWVNDDEGAVVRKAFLGFLIQAFKAKGMEIPSMKA